MSSSDPDPDGARLDREITLRVGPRPSSRNKSRTIPRVPPLPTPSTIESPESCDGICGKIMVKWGLDEQPASPLLSLDPESISSRPDLNSLPGVSEYFTISHERVGDIRELPDSTSDKVQQLPYEICCVCGTCRVHRESIKEHGCVSNPNFVRPGRPPSMAPIFRPADAPNRFLTCSCPACASHLEMIDQLAEKVGIGALKEVAHWRGVSWEDIVISDWQDILGKKQQAYWSFKALGDLALRREPVPIGLEKILRVIEALEAVTFLPVELTRQVQGEPLSFDKVLLFVFAKCMLGINIQVSRLFDGKVNAEICHQFLLLVDTFKIYAHSYAVTSRSANIAVVAEVEDRLNTLIPEGTSTKHTFTGIRFDETNEAWLETRPVILPRFVPLNHSRRAPNL